MIKTKEDLRYYLSEDRKNYPVKPTWKDRLIKSDNYYIWNFLTELRLMEYIENNSAGLIGKIRLKYHMVKFHRLIHKTQMHLYPHVFGPGLYIPHLGYMLVSNKASIGKNCTVRPGLLIATNLGKSDTTLRKVVVGDDVEFSAGCVILCKKIGNNVTVGPNAVVTKNVPDNSTVMGNPGTIVPKFINIIK